LGYSKKQIQRYKRLKYISALNKITKNLYRLFKNPSTTSSALLNRFNELKDYLDSLEKPYLESEYLIRTKEYIDNLHYRLNNREFDDSILNSIREDELANLNRLQKMKNSQNYNRKKFKQEDLEEF